MGTPRNDDVRKPRLLEVDLLRLVAALMVVMTHFMASAGAKDRYSRAFGSIFEWGHPMASITYFGQLGVDIFFMISGFVIALSAENRSVQSFLASRAARLLPAFWFCCLLTWVAIKLDPGYRHVSLDQLAANLLFVARPLGYEFVDGVYWSLVIEVRFYLLVAVLMWWHGMKAFPIFLSLWLALTVIDMLGVLPSAIRFAAIPQFAPCFVVGGALYLVRQGRRVGLAYSLLVGALVLACIKATQRIPPLFAFQGLAIAIVLLIAAAVLWLIATNRTAVFGRPWMAVAGALTFPLYLLHEDLGYLFMRHFPATGLSWVDNRFTITMLAVMLFLILSYAVVQLVEKPLAPLVRVRLSAPAPASSGEGKVHG